MKSNFSIIASISLICFNQHGFDECRPLSASSLEDSSFVAGSFGAPSPIALGSQSASPKKQMPEGFTAKEVQEKSCVECDVNRISPFSDLKKCDACLARHKPNEFRVCMFCRDVFRYKDGKSCLGCAPCLLFFKAALADMNDCLLQGDMQEGAVANSPVVKRQGIELRIQDLLQAYIGSVSSFSRIEKFSDAQELQKIMRSDAYTPGLRVYVGIKKLENGNILHLWKTSLPAMNKKELFSDFVTRCIELLKVNTYSSCELEDTSGLVSYEEKIR